MFYQRMVSRAPTDRDGTKIWWTQFSSIEDNEDWELSENLHLLWVYFWIITWNSIYNSFLSQLWTLQTKTSVKSLCLVFVFAFAALSLCLFLSFSLCLLSALKLLDQDQQCPHLLKPTTISRWCQGSRLGGVKGAAAFNLVFVFVFCLCRCLCVLVGGVKGAAAFNLLSK